MADDVSTDTTPTGATATGATATGTTAAGTTATEAAARATGPTGTEAAGAGLTGTEAAGAGAAGAGAGTARLRRFEWPPVRGVWRRELALFSRYWMSSSFAATVEPTIYLLAFGFGFGALLGHVAGYRYVDFVGTGVVATAVLFTSVFPGMFNTYIRRNFQHSYDAVLAAPVDVHEVVAGEASWISVKSGVYSCVPLLVAMAFGLRPAAGMLAVPIFTFLTAVGFALFGIWASTVVPSINSFDYIISGVLAPLFLLAGTFFPIDGLPGWARAVARINPLYHCVQLVRHAVFGFHPLADLGHIGALALFAALMWIIAVRGMRRRLID